MRTIIRQKQTKDEPIINHRRICCPRCGKMLLWPETLATHPCYKEYIANVGLKLRTWDFLKQGSYKKVDLRQVGQGINMRRF